MQAADKLRNKMVLRQRSYLVTIFILMEWHSQGSNSHPLSTLLQRCPRVKTSFAPIVTFTEIKKKQYDTGPYVFQNLPMYITLEMITFLQNACTVKTHLF